MCVCSNTGGHLIIGRTPIIGCRVISRTSNADFAKFEYSVVSCMKN